MTPDQAEDFATRTLAAIDAAMRRKPYLTTSERADADRERVASDLDLHSLAADALASDLRPALLWQTVHGAAERGLRRTARLYGVTE